MSTLRAQLVESALSWESKFGNAPQITTVLSEYDAALLVGCSEEEYSQCMRGVTAVQKGFDFVYKNKKYQIKGNRPSGKPGSIVTWVPKATNYKWDFLVWVLYNPNYEIQEAWLWEVEAYKAAFHKVKRLSPKHYRGGKQLA